MALTNSVPFEVSSPETHDSVERIRINSSTVSSGKTMSLNDIEKLASVKVNFVSASIIIILIIKCARD